MRKYRICTNGLVFRVEYEILYNAPWPWSKLKKACWCSLSGTQATLEEAQARKDQQILDDEACEHGWTPVETVPEPTANSANMEGK